MSDVETLEKLIDRVKTQQVEARMIKKQREEKFAEINELIHSEQYLTVIQDDRLVDDDLRKILSAEVTEDTYQEFSAAFEQLQESMSKEVGNLVERYRDI